jgi:hypothetical protein
MVLRDFPRYDEVMAIDPAKFYPLDLYVDLVEFINRKLSRQVILKIGRSVAREVIRESLSKMNLRNAGEAIRAVQQAHEHFCRPAVGEFRVTSETGTAIVVRYTAPYDCVLQEGLFLEIALAYGNSLANIEHRECRRRGAQACVYQISLAPPR